MNAIAATGGAAIVEWAQQTSKSRREFGLRSALALALLTTGVGLGDELIHPHELPKVAIESADGTNETGKFVAVSGGNAYVVKDSKLVILPSSSYTELTITGTKTKPSHEESIFNRLWP